MSAERRFGVGVFAILSCADVILRGSGYVAVANAWAGSSSAMELHSAIA